MHFSAVFTNGYSRIEVNGFYDGDGVYRVRFMPERQGEWRFETRSNRWPLTNHRGAFTVTPPSKGNHGPVGVRHTYHFGYADGTPFRQIGTTSYTWTHWPEEQTLKTFAASPQRSNRPVSGCRMFSNCPGKHPVYSCPDCSSLG